MDVTPRAISNRYQAAARVWLTLAAASLLLPISARLGLWLPLHLALAGAVATAISGAMQNFMLTLTATGPPARWTVVAQFALVTTGAAAIAIGRPAGWAWLVGLGGSAFVAAMGVLGWMLVRAWRHALNRRHVLPIVAYGAAVAAVLLGGTLGALLGAGVVPGGSYVHVRTVHLSLNVLGFASLTVVGTLVTLLPTVLRVRMPVWRGRLLLGLLIAGLLLQLLGADLSSPAVSVAGGVAYALGALGMAAYVVTVLRVPRRFRPPVAALHLVAGIAWFVVGSLGLAVALGDGVAGLVAFRGVFLVAFVGGWLLQVLLGAWSFLLPMQRPGHPDDRRRSLAALELGAPFQVVVGNIGLALLALHAAGWVDDRVGAIGVVLAGIGGVMALAKAWLHPLLGRGPVETERAKAVWGDHGS